MTFWGSSAALFTISLVSEAILSYSFFMSDVFCVFTDLFKQGVGVRVDDVWIVVLVDLSAERCTAVEINYD